MTVEYPFDTPCKHCGFRWSSHIDGPQCPTGDGLFVPGETTNIPSQLDHLFCGYVTMVAVHTYDLDPEERKGLEEIQELLANEISHAFLGAV